MNECLGIYECFLFVFHAMPDGGIK